MSKKTAWFCVVKSFFGSGRHPGAEKGRRKWIFRLLKMKRLAPLSEASTPKKIALRTRPPPCSYESHELAVIRIQAAFRGYLAREALRALKGIVKLQALIRGWTVRKQALNTLKCLQSIVNLQTEVCAKRSQKVMERLHSKEFLYSHCFGEKHINVDLSSQRNWDAASRKEPNALKDRIIRDYLSHRRSADTERDKLYQKQRYWLEQWVDTQLAKSEANSKTQRQHLRPLELPNSAGARRSHQHRHRKQHSSGDEIQVMGSPSLPAYMAATESARAKTRSISTPRNRNLSFDVCSENNYPYTYGRISPVSSMHSEVPPSSFVRSPGLKATMSFKGV